MPSATTSELASATLAASCAGGGLQLAAAGTTWLTSPQSAAVRASTSSPVSSICRARLRPTARVSATMGVVQKSPIFTPGVAKAASSDGNRQVAGGHQLAAGGGGDALHLGDHRLRNGLNLRHQLRAHVEDAAVFVDVAAGHLAKIVAGAEDLAGRRQNHGADLAVAADLVQAANQLQHQVERQGVAALRAVQSHHRDGPLVSHANVFESHVATLPAPRLSRRCASPSGSENRYAGSTGNPFRGEPNESTGLLPSCRCRRACRDASFPDLVREAQPGLDRRARLGRSGCGRASRRQQVPAPRRRSKTAPDAVVRFAPVSLTIGKRYELSGWVRTEDLTVRDLDRSPIAIGAALDHGLHAVRRALGVRSAARSRGRGSPCKFIASRAQDQILLTAGNGGAFQRQGVVRRRQPRRSLVRRRVAHPRSRPDLRSGLSLSRRRLDLSPHRRQALRARLPARPPDGPRDSRIPGALRRRSRVDEDQWNQYRTTANALFLRGFDREILEEMRGIADGASDAGAKWLNRRIDLMDIVVANVTVEMGELRGRRVHDRHRTRRARASTSPPTPAQARFRHWIIAAPSPPPARPRATAR